MTVTTNTMSKRFPEGEWPRWTERVREVENQGLDHHLHKVVEQAKEEAKEDYSTLFGVLTQHCESPIEALFVAAFVYVLLRDPSYKLTPQALIGDYRVDFLITLGKDGVERHVIVECDGHDYHERSKQQAERDKSRDRAITSHGLPVFRFTGRELHRNAWGCVEEVLDFTQGQLLEEINEERRRGR